MISIVVILIIITIIILFHITMYMISNYLNKEENFTPVIQASNDELPVSPNESDKISGYMKQFNNLMNFNVIQIPSNYKASITDNSKGKDWNVYPYYQIFPIDLNNSLLEFINTKLNDTEFANDTITIIKQPYDIYYKKQLNNNNIKNDPFALSYDLVNEYIFTIDIEDMTKMFNSSIIFYSKISNTSFEIIATKNFDNNDNNLDNNNNNNSNVLLAMNEQSYYYKYS